MSLFARHEPQNFTGDDARRITALFAGQDEPAPEQVGVTTYDVTEARALAIMDELRPVLGTEWEPTLYEPGFHHDTARVIASESGPHDWVHQAAAFINGDRQTGLFAEPVNHWSIALFPGECGCGQLRKAEWELQIWLERIGEAGQRETLCLHLQLCAAHKGVAEDHVPPGWTLYGRSYVRGLFQ